MNIAIFSPNHDVYSETFIRAHKEHLKGQVYYYSGNINSIKLDGVQIPRLKKGGKVIRLLRKLNGTPLYLTKQEALLNSFVENSIDVILVEYGIYAHQLLPILTKLSIPFVVHFHGYDASVNSEIEKCDNYKEVFQFASKIIGVSKKMESMLLEMGCPPEKLLYNVYGPQPDFIKVSPSFNKKQFVGIGRFTDKKAPYYTIMAFAKVVEKHPEAKLVLAGDGDLFNCCHNLINFFKLQNNVTLLGVITPDEYRTLLSESLAFVQHSITALNGDMEGTPLAILEASAAGLPVVATKHAGIPDVIVHQKTGLLCDEHDVDGMAENMIKILDNVTLAQEMGAQGKKNIQTNFSLERHISELQKILEAAVK